MACAVPARNEEPEDLWGPEMEQLTQILQECHLHEADLCGSSPSPAPAPALGGHGTGLAPLGNSSSVGPWADELVRQLQHCCSAEEGRNLCAEALVAFQRHQAGTCCNDPNSCPHLARLQKLQGANKVIVRALRVYSQRHNAAQARCRQADEANSLLGEQLRQCQEQLAASERAKANLQSHLQLMNSNLGESAYRSHGPGPCN